MAKNFPRPFISILHNWFSKSNAMVRWEKAFSYSVRLPASVRQGLILAPFLFAIFVKDVLNKLGLCGLACRLKTINVNAIMYADDLLLMSTSITELQMLINLASALISDCGLTMNAAKTICIRISSRHRIDSCSLTVDGIAIGFKRDLRYPFWETIRC